MVKSRFEAVVRYPLSWVVVGITVVVVLAMIVQFEPGVGAIVLLFLMGMVGLAAWVGLMAMTGLIEERQNIDLEPEVLRTDIEPAMLQIELRKLEDRRPLQQLKMLQSKRINLVDILSKRLDSREEGFSSYVVTTDRVYESTLFNLHEAGIAIRSMEAIDVDYVHARLAELDPTDPDGADERATLEKRLALHSAQLDKASDLKALVEASLTSLDQAANVIGDAAVDETKVDAAEAMAELEQMALPTPDQQAN
jgi:hypothetical protein